MKKISWVMLALFSAAAAGLRAWQMKSGFDAEGLPVPGCTAALLLPAVLLAAAAYFVFDARTLPSHAETTGTMPERFLFQDTTAAIAAVSGAFLLLAGAALSLQGGGVMGAPLLSAFVAAAALSVLYAVFALYRGNAVQPLVLLVPVFCAVACMIYFYHERSTDPIVQGAYVGVLAMAALMASTREIAAFAFLDGTPRVFVPVGALSLVLCLAVAAEWRGMTQTLIFVGCALLELGFLAALDVRT